VFPFHEAGQAHFYIDIRKKNHRKKANIQTHCRKWGVMKLIIEIFPEYVFRIDPYTIPRKQVHDKLTCAE
jgi:hypothetical protein